MHDEFVQQVPAGYPHVRYTMHACMAWGRRLFRHKQLTHPRPLPGSHAPQNVLGLDLKQDPGDGGSRIVALVVPRRRGWFIRLITTRT